MTLSTITYNTKDLSESRFNQIDWDNLKFGKEFSDHMFVMEYSDGAWKQGEIVPFSNIPMHPAMSAIHYGQSIFEGLKAYRGVDGKIRIFRPDMNAKRFSESAKRMSMPELPENVFVATPVRRPAPSVPSRTTISITWSMPASAMAVWIASHPVPRAPLTTGARSTKRKPTRWKTN